MSNRHLQTQKIYKKGQTQRPVEDAKKLLVAERPKERMLSLFDEHVQGDKVNSELFQQLQAKDNFIELLNERLLTATALAKNADSLATKDKLIHTLLGEKAAQAESLRTTQAKGLELEYKQQISEQRLEKEKAELSLQITNLTNENEAQKEKMQDQAEQVKTSNLDVERVSKMSHDLAKLNDDLHKRIKALEEEMRRKTEECEAAVNQVAQMKETERELVQAHDKLQKLQVKYTEEASEAQSLRELLSKVGLMLGEVREKVSLVDHEASREALGRLDELASEIISQERVLKFHAEKQASLMRNYKKAKKNLQGQRQIAAKATASEQVHLDQVKSLTLKNERLNKSLDEKDESFKQLQEEMEKASAEIKEIKQKAKELHFSEETKQKQLDSLQVWENQLKAQLEKLQHEVMESRQETWKLRLELIELRAKYETLQETRYKYEQIARASQNKLDVLIDQLWIRDNDLLSKETLRLKLQEELNLLKTSLQSLQARLKHQAESMQKVELLLAEKNKDIAELKRLLRNDEK